MLMSWSDYNESLHAISSMEHTGLTSSTWLEEMATDIMRLLSSTRRSAGSHKHLSPEPIFFPPGEDDYDLYSVYVESSGDPEYERNDQRVTVEGTAPYTIAYPLSTRVPARCVCGLHRGQKGEGKGSGGVIQEVCEITMTSATIVI